MNSADELNNEMALAHDIRGLNSQIKPNIENVIAVIRKDRGIHSACENAALTVFHASELITKRLGIYEYLKNPTKISLTDKRISAHRSLFKARKILDFQAKLDNKEIEINESYIEFNCSNYFEVALFVVLENCVKYCRKKDKIKVDINELSGVDICFSNMGPALDQAEMEQIYTMGYRGNLAKKHSKSGSGIGMYFVKKICDVHGFKIELRQDGKREFTGGIQYAMTYINITIPPNRKNA